LPETLVLTKLFPSTQLSYKPHVNPNVWCFNHHVCLFFHGDVARFSVVVFTFSPANIGYWVSHPTNPKQVSIHLGYFSGLTLLIHKTQGEQTYNQRIPRRKVATFRNVTRCAWSAARAWTCRTPTSRPQNSNVTMVYHRYTHNNTVKYY